MRVDTLRKGDNDDVDDDDDDDNNNNNNKYYQIVVSTVFGVYLRKVRIRKELKILWIGNKIFELRMRKERDLCQTSGFRRGVIQVLALPGCYAT
jgi:hypothetical protein